MTSDLLLDWSKFQGGPVSPAKAFEAFSAQLFERRVRREYRDNLRFYALHGAGGDGGVEAFATLVDGPVIGLQAKWFPENLNVSRIKQIWGSITTAMTRYPSLVRYVVTMPCNLTPAGPAPKRGGRKGRPPKGGVERWQKLIDRVTTAYPGLALERWDEQGLRGQLDLAANHELYAAWFSGTFLSISDLHLAWEKARGRLRDRYLPDLHASGAIEEALASDLFEPSWVHSTRCAVADARAQFIKALNTVEDLQLHLILQADSDFALALQDASAVLRAWCIHVDLLDAALCRGPMGDIPDAPDAKPLWIFADMVKAEREKALGWHASELMRAPLQSAVESVTVMQEVHSAWIAACRPRAVVGPPGCGKTHAGAHAVNMQLNSGTPAIFVAARFVDLSQGLPRILQEVLDRPGWSLRQLLDGLEALAVVSQCTDEATEQHSSFKRTLLVLDGLEESVGWQQWEPLMADLAVECKRRPRLRLLLTMRPETARRVDLPDEFAVQYVHEDADIALPELFCRYCKHYKVNAHEVPWLGWAVRTPLEIRLIAEEFCGRTLTHNDGLRANVMGLFQRKLRRMEDEARTAAGVKAWSTGLPLLSTVLSVIVDLTRDLVPSMVEDRRIIQLVQEKDDEFTAERIRFALQRLVSHGLVDEWQPASQDLIPMWPVYGVATHHLSDFVVAQSSVVNVLPLLRGGQMPSYPASFVARPEAAILFAALLAEEGYFVTDDIWADETRPAHVTTDLLSALALVAPHVAQTRRGWVQQVLLASTKGNREALRRVIVPVARLPHHLLGPPLLDEALRGLSLAERDQIWSVPDDLSGTGPWQGWANDILDQIDLDAEGDPWDGRPLVLAWSCSSVVEARRRRARALLAVWGSCRLCDMVCLLDHMARVDDPQVVEDVVVAALGAVSGAPFNDEALVPLAMTVDRLFFRDDAEAWTPDAIVRIAARGIVERVALLCPGAVDHLLKRARPPYEPRGLHWPELDVDEARDHSFRGGKIVTRDLSWYVADDCFSPFHRERRARPVEQEEDLLASVDQHVLDAVVAGQLFMPAEVVQRCRGMVEQRNQRSQQYKVVQRRREMVEQRRSSGHSSTRRASCVGHRNNMVVRLRLMSTNLSGRTS